MSIGERIKQIRATRSQDDFAAKIGLSKGAVGSYERDVSVPCAGAIISICEQFNVRFDWLLVGEGPMLRTSAPLTGAPSTSNADEALFTVPRVLPQFCEDGTLQPASGLLRHAFSSAWLRSKGQPSAMALLDVTGDSMAPLLQHGDCVLIDQSQTRLYGHGVYVLAIDALIYIKEVLSEPGVLILRSCNPSYADIRIEQTGDARILGRVLWVGHDLG